MIRHKNSQHLLLHLLSTIFFLHFNSISTIDFIFNGFNSSNVLLFGNATIDSQILTLTHDQSFSIGRALYPKKIPTKNSSFVYPFSTSFIFSISMAPFEDTLPGNGLVFIFTPIKGIQGTSSAQHLGLFNLTNNGNSNNHVFGVEFDVFMNQEFDDINDNHVGIDINSLKSYVSYDVGFWSDDGKSEKDKIFKKLKLNNGENYQVWIDYEDSLINVTLAKLGMKKPIRPLLNVSLNLSDVFEDEMFVGFTSSTGQLVESHKILGWSFSNTNFSLSDELITIGLPSFVLPKDSIFKSKGFVAGFSVIVFFIVCVLVLLVMFLIQKKRKREKKRSEMEDWELEYWPHRMSYEEIEASTKKFSEENVIGIGGNGKVYKGVLRGGVMIAVKNISHENDGLREFLAEVSTLGRLKQRNLVGLRGWCKKNAGNFLLVYDYMENGSLDKYIFEKPRRILKWEERFRIIKGVACGLVYLHEEWEQTVIHRDVKAGNVLLDSDMNAKLGDFGLAKLYDHGENPSTTRVVGTMGYLAPELTRTGKPTTSSDVFAFGALLLEVVCGRRPIEAKALPEELVLVDWVWDKWRVGEVMEVVDKKLGGVYDEVEVLLVVKVGLMCSDELPGRRPTMRQVVRYLEGEVKLPEIDEFGGKKERFLYRRSEFFERENTWSSAGDDVESAFASSLQLSGGR
jgi:hypothetical protein